MTLGMRNPERGKEYPIFSANTGALSSRKGNFSAKKTDLLFRIAVQIVAMSCGLRPVEIMQASRGVAKVVRARQIACYLLHTSLSISLVEIAKYFQKDRTTIGHACRLVEDWRDEPVFDDELIELEATALLLKSLALENLEGEANE